MIAVVVGVVAPVACHDDKLEKQGRGERVEVGSPFKLNGEDVVKMW
jgi:hypothetical protein